jgi:hypothetical protein
MSRSPKDPGSGPSRPRDRDRDPDRGRERRPRDPSVFVQARDTGERPPSRWKWYALGFLAIVAIGAVGLMVAWPSLHPRKLDAVERVAEAYLKALTGEEPDSARRFGIVEEPPAIRSLQSYKRDRSHDRSLKGSFAPLGKLHKQIETDFVYDASIGRFTPKNAMGAAAETLDALHKAKEDAEKSGLYKKMESGNPDDLFDAAEQYGKVFTKLADGVLAPKKILPTYQMLIESAKPPLPQESQALAMEAAGSLPSWDALLKRPFQTLKADGPFIYERARVNAIATDRLASLGDPPSRLRLELVRFRLEGIDTGWKVVSARRVLPGDVEKAAKPAEPPEPPASKSTTDSPGELKRSPGDPTEPH